MGEAVTNPRWRPRFEALLGTLFPGIQIHLDEGMIERHRELKRQEEFQRRLDEMNVSDIPGYRDVVFRLEEVKLPPGEGG